MTSSFISSVSDNKVLLEHDGARYICIHDIPFQFPHQSLPEAERLQHTDMIDFQDRISMVVRAQMKQVGVVLPFKSSRYRLEISITTSRDLQEIPLCETMKSIMDGINGEVIPNDADIYECTIKYQQQHRLSRHPKGRADDVIDLVIIDLSTGQLLVNIADLNTYIVPKKSAILLNRHEDELWNLHYEFYYVDVWDALNRDQFRLPNANSYNVRMDFCGSIHTKDLDNMARCYLPLLYETKNIREDNIVMLELYKEVNTSNSDYVKISVTCN